MTISSRFTVGVHILALLEFNQETAITSEFIAASVNTNPALIRKLMGMLKKAHLIDVKPGVAGAKLAKNLSEITLLDVYHAVHAVKENELFSVHKAPTIDCEVGNNIQLTLTPVLHSAQKALEDQLASVTMEAIVHDMKSS
ncbi:MULTISPECIES: Rrf2 family transcriptional regulator [Shouchella]|uniref:HTH-type transcriptional regulator ywnA n=3 Tax=Bacillaceae TaxID=186817 RepID=A0A060M101_9BACI|nr:MULTISPECIES: Rrf2 family transcriptional regulator [Bacillaceae]RQW18707.1 transcriptional regulator [Bacillus sp. C1-1]AIC96077.1 HTH-type transcriptional regulator ywnA [Shouchella lehensis G1]KQL56747.1 Rrf2 family transcriptional regulator [Alkalicoccobacillus plakortidis]MBG9785006.1 Rrf2 family transcriptional regulator [Shouchella lehensis]TES46429.1 transcriptional regulator [Shouchella lehensis]